MEQNSRTVVQITVLNHGNSPMYSKEIRCNDIVYPPLRRLLLLGEDYVGRVTHAVSWRTGISAVQQELRSDTCSHGVVIVHLYTCFHKTCIHHTYCSIY